AGLRPDHRHELGRRPAGAPLELRLRLHQGRPRLLLHRPGLRALRARRGRPAHPSRTGPHPDVGARRRGPADHQQGRGGPHRGQELRTRQGCGLRARRVRRGHGRAHPRAAADLPQAPLLSPAVALRGIGLAGAAAVIAAVVTAVVLGAFSLVTFPAYGNSNVLLALTVAGQAAALALVAAGVLCARAGERAPGRAALVRVGTLAAPTGSALLVATTLGIPLAATRLYLHGVSVDQEFRTQFLTRSTTSLGLPDMAYADLPSFYPSGWFWLGGRFADLAGLEGWAAYKPWSILSLAVAAALVTVLWTRLLRTDLGAVVAAASVSVMLAHGSPEPYGAVVALFIPPVLLLAWHAVSPTGRRGGRGATLATLLFLGASACMYTLYTGLAAATVVLMALVATVLAWWRSRPYPVWLPAARLAVIGVGSLLLALIVWAP